MRTISILFFFILASCGSADGTSAAPADGTRDRPLSFVLKRRYEMGGRTAVKLRNKGARSYTYNPFYEACDMVFRERSGRKFIIPEGTHCDLQADEEVEPGETVTLFRWDLDECTKDNWGCRKSKDLPPDKYLMRGWFKPKGGGKPVRVTGRFRIVES